MLLRKIKSQKGFTLIELLVVVAIIAILAVLVLANLSSARPKARDAQRKSALRELQTALEVYYTDNESYPVTAGNSCDHNTKSIFDTDKTKNPLLLGGYLKTVIVDPVNDKNKLGASGNPLCLYYYYLATGGAVVGGDNYDLKANVENAGDPACKGATVPASKTGQTFKLCEYIVSTP